MKTRTLIYVTPSGTELLQAVTKDGDTFFPLPAVARALSYTRTSLLTEQIPDGYVTHLLVDATVPEGGDTVGRGRSRRVQACASGQTLRTVLNAVRGARQAQAQLLLQWLYLNFPLPGDPELDSRSKLLKLLSALPERSTPHESSAFPITPTQLENAILDGKLQVDAHGRVLMPITVSEQGGQLKLGWPTGPVGVFDPYAV